MIVDWYCTERGSHTCYWEGDGLTRHHRHWERDSMRLSWLMIGMRQTIKTNVLMDRPTCMPVCFLMCAGAHATVHIWLQRTTLQSQFFQHADPRIELKSELESSALAIEHLSGPRGSLIFQEGMYCASWTRRPKKSMDLEPTLWSCVGLKSVTTSWLPYWLHDWLWQGLDPEEDFECVGS